MIKQTYSIVLGFLACTGPFTLGCGGGGGDTSGGGGNGPVGGSITVTASGEALALGGYSFPPPMGEGAFVDGWEVKFTGLLVTFDKITLSENPDNDPGDQSKTGPVVAEANGPWAVDLHKGGPLPGKGGTDEQAVELTKIDKQNKNGDKPFASDQRYAFGFDIVPATASAKLVNLDEQGKADYALMQQKGYTVLYVGTATFKGTDCMPTGGEFDKLPKVVNFKFGFKSPTTYLNCQNPDNDPAKPLSDAEESERGIAIKPNQAVTAQLTVHTDHPFWEGLVHDAPLHFDPIAGRYVGAKDTPTASLEDMVGVDITGFKDKNGATVPWRTCTKDYTPPGTSAVHFTTGSILVDPKGDPTKVIRDYYDYLTYNQSTQGHLNADGLCAVKRSYPSPP